MEEPKENKEKKLEDSEKTEVKETEVKEENQQSSDTQKEVSESTVKEEKKPAHENKHEHNHHEQHAKKHEEHKHAHKHHEKASSSGGASVFWPILSAILLLAVIVLLVDGNFFGGSDNKLDKSEVKTIIQEVALANPTVSLEENQKEVIANEIVAAPADLTKADVVNIVKDVLADEARTDESIKASVESVANAKNVDTLSEEEIKVKAQKFINTNLMQPGTSATVTNVKPESGMYVVSLNVAGSPFTSYMTSDGKIFFPQEGIKIDEYKAPAQTNNAQAAPVPDVPKQETPEVEVFVMSYCPYGTQVEKGLLPVVDLLGDKADIQVKFVNYAMHGKKEVDENTNQYCIQQEYPDQYYAYLQCFLKEGDSATCIEKQGFDQTKLDECIAATDKKFDITADFEDKASWNGGQYPKFEIYEAENQKYGVRGSPTLIINGQQVSVGRDSNSLKSAICNAFSEAPEECDTALPTASPSPGFGFGTSGTDSAAANCGV